MKEYCNNNITGLNPLVCRVPYKGPSFYYTTSKNFNFEITSTIFCYWHFNGAGFITLCDDFLYGAVRYIYPSSAQKKPVATYCSIREDITCKMEEVQETPEYLPYQVMLISASEIRVES